MHYNIPFGIYAEALHILCTDIIIHACIRNMYETFTMSQDGLYGTLNVHNTNALCLFDGLSKPLFSYMARPQTHELHKE